MLRLEDWGKYSHGSSGKKSPTRFTSSAEFVVGGFKTTSSHE